ncbi:MAG: hypothetical protein K0Q83_3750 [Deltaproteobacteria bacterium]|nr:hypothetical protein [Deltaproteobacteria bacterium]
MNPMFIVAIPIVLVIIGMVLNSTGLSFDQPPTSSEQDPAKRSAAEADAYRRFFDVQRKQAVRRQARVGQYAWLLMAERDGSLDHFEGREQCQIFDQTTHSRNLGSQQERRNLERESFILRNVATTHGF